jgi:hypothetical protein
MHYLDERPARLLDADPPPRPSGSGRTVQPPALGSRQTRHHGPRPSPAPRCPQGHLLNLQPDATYQCRTCRQGTPGAVFVPLAGDLVAELQATPGVAFRWRLGWRRPYVLTP